MFLAARKAGRQSSAEVEGGAVGECAGASSEEDAEEGLVPEESSVGVCPGSAGAESDGGSAIVSEEADCGGGKPVPEESSVTKLAAARFLPSR